MTIVFYISGHGWGHASRCIELINALGRRAPGAGVIARTAVSPRLFEATAQIPVEVRPVETDPGIAQVDSLRIDEDATITRAAAFYRDFDRRVEHEAKLLDQAGASLVVGDIPPLAFAASARAGVPSVALGNFTWDWIYGGYPRFTQDAPDVLSLMRDAYGHATCALRLPMHGGFDAMTAVIRDIPFIARRSGRAPTDTRRRLGVGRGQLTALASFGGYGLDLPYARIARANDLVVLDARVPLPEGLRHEDLVAAVDVVVSKPGYGIISECCANGTPLLYTSRGRFNEYDLLVAEMPRVVRCRYLPQEDLLEGRWAEAIRALLSEPSAPERPRLDGAEVAAGELINLGIE